ncbi:MAG: CPBP family intramembrane glutamic endopeptidase [Kofleriaceae bacterium]
MTRAGRAQPGTGRRASRTARATQARLEAPQLASRDDGVLASLALIFPALLVYQLAIVVVPSVVATDPISRLVYRACGGRGGYLLAQAGLALGYLAWLHGSGRTRVLALRAMTPVLVEAAAIAALLRLGLPVLVHRALGLELGGAATTAVSAIGAGVYEELVFRLLLLGGVARVARALGLSPRVAATVAITLSALAFAVAHHVGAAGEALHASAFAFRALAGVALGATFWLRSLAHATYAHIFYDLLALTLSA